MGRGTADGVFATFTALGLLLLVCMHAGLTESIGIQKALRWLKSIQNDDGSWGESCKSAEIKTYVPLHRGTIVQTAWALDAFFTYENSEHPSVVKGMQYLTDSSSHSTDSLAYPAGIGLPKQFYIRYHSYPYVFSLLAVGKYLDSIEKETANET